LEWIQWRTAPSENLRHASRGGSRRVLLLQSVQMRTRDSAIVAIMRCSAERTFDLSRGDIAQILPQVARSCMERLPSSNGLLLRGARNSERQTSSRRSVVLPTHTNTISRLNSSAPDSLDRCGSQRPFHARCRFPCFA
jgi:hypothetical protein